MTPDSNVFRIVGRGERAACAVAGLTSSAAILGALALCFNAASPDNWLQPTPALTASIARCDAQRSRSAQTQCKKRVVAEWQAPDPKPVQVAKQ
jgi:hypothetical protein